MFNALSNFIELNQWYIITYFILILVWLILYNFQRKFLETYQYWINTVLNVLIFISMLVFNDPILDRVSENLSEILWRNASVYQGILLRLSITFIIISWSLKVILDRISKRMATENKELKESLIKAQAINATWKNDIPDIIKGHLYTFADGKLWFCDNTCADHRISVYVPKDDSWEDFYLLWRYSPNPDLWKKSWREYTKWDMIWKVWTGAMDWELVQNLSDPENNFWKDYQSDCKREFWWTKKEAKSKFSRLKMKARYYYGYRIISSLDQSKYVALILVESMEPNFKSKEEIHWIMAGHHTQFSEFLTRIIPHFPKPYEGSDF